MRVLPVLLSTLFTIATCAAQPAPRAFEVASIRPVELKNVMVEYSAAGPVVTFEVFNIPALVIEAYDLKNYQLDLSPDLFRTVEGFYTITAKAPGAQTPTRAEAREMLKELLSSRFHLKIHMESRETAVYSLRVGKNGIKARESKPEEQEANIRRVRGRNQTIEATHMTAEQLARELSNLYVDRPVVDQTGLIANYHIDLEATPYFRLTNNPQPDDITIFTAIQTLGLRLEADRVAMPIVVVDAVERPTEN